MGGGGGVVFFFFFFSICFFNLLSIDIYVYSSFFFFEFHLKWLSHCFDGISMVVSLVALQSKFLFCGQVSCSVLPTLTN